MKVRVIRMIEITTSHRGSTSEEIKRAMRKMNWIHGMKEVMDSTTRRAKRAVPKMKWMGGTMATPRKNRASRENHGIRINIPVVIMVIEMIE